MKDFVTILCLLISTFALANNFQGKSNETILNIRVSSDESGYDYFGNYIENDSGLHITKKGNKVVASIFQNDSTCDDYRVLYGDLYQDTIITAGQDIILLKEGSRVYVEGCEDHNISRFEIIMTED